MAFPGHTTFLLLIYFSRFITCFEGEEIVVRFPCVISSGQVFKPCECPHLRSYILDLTHRLSPQYLFGSFGIKFISCCNSYGKEQYLSPSVNAFDTEKYEESCPLSRLQRVSPLVHITILL